MNKIDPFFRSLKYKYELAEQVRVQAIPAFKNRIPGYKSSRLRWGVDEETLTPRVYIVITTTLEPTQRIRNIFANMFEYEVTFEVIGK